MPFRLPKTTIIGFGRFGALWADLLRHDAEIVVFDSDPSACDRARQAGHQVAPLEEALRSEVVFYAVPISAFEAVFASHLPILKARTTPLLIADLLSVKLHPKEVFDRLLPENCNAVLIHPMFGPDSVRHHGIEGLSIVIDRYRSNTAQSDPWISYFRERGLSVVELSAEEHDRLAAGSQGVTHVIGRLLGEIGFHPTAIDTVGAKKLGEIKDQVCNDTLHLFTDLQSYNPFTLDMRIALWRAQEKIYNQLIPNRMNRDTLVVAIQGGKGSFNEQAILYYLNRAKIDRYEIQYLHTTEQVLKALHEGRVDRGQFAIHNSVGGIVNESIEAMALYTFHIIEEYGIKISHTLMIHPDAQLDEIQTVMSHPQALRQCRRNLQEKYSRLKLTSGEGDVIDTAKVAELLGSGALPKTVAALGNKALAATYGLSIVEENLQDAENNFTSFLFVERP